MVDSTPEEFADLPDEEAAGDPLQALYPALETASLSDNLISKASSLSKTEPMLRTAQRCHIGAVRSRNEDSCLAFVSESGGQEPMLPLGLFIVADGMGGHYAGHQASRIASRLVTQQVLNSIYLPLLQSDGQTPYSPKEPIQEVLLRAIQAANTTLHNPDPEKDSGTTLTAALILGRRLYLAHVGDSRAYMLTDDKLELVTTDHSYVQRLQEVGQITAEEAASHPHRNVLYRAVGQGADLEIDMFTRSLPGKGKLILCSDGLWGLVPEPMMQEVLERDVPLQQMVDVLVELALQAGGYDNITAVLVDFIL